jgi:hypothetical protein
MLTRPPIRGTIANASRPPDIPGGCPGEARMERGIVDTAWLVRMYEESGLDSAVAARAAGHTLARILRREDLPDPAPGQRRPLSASFVRAPLDTLARLAGKGDGRLPLVDGVAGGLSAPAIAQVLEEAGLESIVALAYAKVVVAAYSPEELYAPLWALTGERGPVDLEALRRRDWTVLRARAAGQPGGVAVLEGALHGPPAAEDARGEGTVVEQPAMSAAPEVQGSTAPGSERVREVGAARSVEAESGEAIRPGGTLRRPGFGPRKP